MPGLLFLILGLAAAGSPPSGRTHQAPEAAPAPQPTKSNAALVKEAGEAHRRGDRAAFLAFYEELARRRPGEVFTLYNLARGQALNGQSALAVRNLEDILTHRVATDLDADADFEAIRETEGYKSVAARMTAFRRERISSGATRAFTIPEKGVIAEGVAYDSVRRTFFVSSIRQRRIVKIDAAGTISDFVPAGRDGLRAAFGISIDPQRRTLWVASGSTSTMLGYQKGEPRGPAVFEYDVDSGKLRKEHVPPKDDDPPVFDDLTLAPDGTVFINDAFHPRVWRISPGGGLQVFLVSEAFGGTQGLAVSAGGKTLYVSDYRSLLAVDLASRRVTRISVPHDLALSGIDGLARYERSLVAIQNGVIPHRVIRLDFAEDGVTISRARILEMNHPDFDEPTLGVAADGVFYFSADSQGQKFRDEKRPITEAEMREAVILKIPLGTPPPHR